MNLKEAMQNRVIIPIGRVKKKVEILIDENNVCHINAVECGLKEQPMDPVFMVLLMHKVLMDYTTRLLQPRQGENYAEKSSDHDNIQR